MVRDGPETLLDRQDLSTGRDTCHCQSCGRNDLAVPNLAVVAYVKVIDDIKLLITDNFLGGTINNISKNNHVCLTTYDKNWSGLKLHGTAEYFTSGKWLKQVKQMPENKGLPAKGAIIVKVQEYHEIG